MKKIFTFGEVMLRISPSGIGELLETDKRFIIQPGGSEANVAVGLSKLGNTVSFITAVPDDKRGRIVTEYLYKMSVQVDMAVRKKDKRLGLYFAEIGNGIRPSFVIYDRDNSAFTELDKRDIPVKNIRDNCKWFHSSGITPALSEKSFKLLKYILAGLGKKTKVSIDLNYRNKLWKWVKNNSRYSVSKCMEEICKDAYLITANEQDFQDIFNFKNKDYIEIADIMFSNNSNLKFIAVSLRKRLSNSSCIWSGLLFIRKNNRTIQYQGLDFKIDSIIDRIGTGDSFTAGIIHGILNYKTEYRKIINFAVTLSALHHSIIGDVPHFTEKEVLQIMNNKGKGGIIR